MDILTKILDFLKWVNENKLSATVFGGLTVAVVVALVKLLPRLWKRKSRSAKLRNNESLLEESIRKYQKAVELKPDDHKAYNNWGLALYDLARLRQDESLFEESIGKYQEAVDLKPDYDKAYFNWGLALSALAELRNDGSLLEESIRKYQKVVEIKHDYYEAYYNWGLRFMI